MSTANKKVIVTFALISWGFIPRPLGRINTNLRVNTPLSRYEKVER